VTAEGSTTLAAKPDGDEDVHMKDAQGIFPYQHQPIEPLYVLAQPDYVVRHQP
jgi:hypothetical protein